MTISGRARLGGVIGDPVAQSLSPLLHAHWLSAYHVDGAYVPLHVVRESFAAAIGGLRAAGFAGVNVTVPHKEAAFAVAHRLDAAALATGAANLLIFRRDRIEGRNTDAAGLSASLEDGLGKNALRQKIVAVFGAGGAARAAIFALNNLGVSEIRLFARNPQRGEALVRERKAASAAVLRNFAWQDWPGSTAGVALLLNATSAGMMGKQALDQSLECLPWDAAVCDLVYNPLETPLLAQARARGHAAIDGLGMLMHQAAPSFEALYGIAPRVTPDLRRTLEEALRHGR